MSRDDLNRIVISTITQLQEQSGRSARGINEKVCPIGDLPGFDSLNGLELSIELSGQLNVPIDSKLLLTPTGGKSPTISQIVDRIIPLC